MRRTLPRRRAAETFTVVCRNQPVTITAGFYDDGTLGEVFITTAKSGADLQNIANDAAVILSLALQHHVSIEVIRHAVTRNGSGEAASLLGVTVDCLATVSVRAAREFAKATLEYDAEHVRALLDAITQAIFETSSGDDIGGNA